VCRLGHREAIERLRQINGLSNKHHFALLCADLSMLGTYAKVSTVQYRILKAVLPGAYTFILPATKEVPKQVYHPSKQSVGLRVPNHAVVQALLAHTSGPLLAFSAHVPGEPTLCHTAWEVQEALGHVLDGIVDHGEYCGAEPSTVVDWTCDPPVVLRVGAGPLVGPLLPLTPVEVQESNHLGGLA
jgi:tRNA threonylcarbamoyl adenosine modification protein (Sua5/YciO/YrdC/YwlC family)